MANNLGKILEFCEIPQVKMAEYLGITPQALSSIIQSESTKKYNDKIAEYIGMDVEFMNSCLSLEKLKMSQLLHIKLNYILSKVDTKTVDKVLRPQAIKLHEQIYLEQTIEEVREILENNDDEIGMDKWLLDIVIDFILKKETKYGIIEYNIIKDFLLMLDRVSKAMADVKLNAYQDILSFIKEIKTPEKDISKYIENLKIEKENKE